MKIITELVTVGQYQEFNPNHQKDKDKNLPVTMVSSHNAEEYVRWFSKEKNISCKLMTNEDYDSLYRTYWEWTCTKFDDNSRVVRGGSFKDFMYALRAAFRNRYGPGFRLVNLGFRIVIEI